MAEKPKTAFILSLIGGIFVLVVGSLVITANGAHTGGFNLGLLGVIWGILMMIGAGMLYSRPQQHKTWGIIVIVLSFLSWFVLALAGLIGVAGFMLGLIGGSLGIRWKPSVVQPAAAAPQPQRQRKSKT